MPIYEYHCKACGKHTEILQKFSDKPVTECPDCHAHKLKRQVSAPSFQLKGTGWYVTDFKGDKKKSDGDSDKKPDKKAESTKEDKKPAKKESD